MNTKRARSASQKRSTKGGVTMWQRLDHFQGDFIQNSGRLEVLAEWLEAGGEALSPERREAGAQFLRRLLNMPAVMKAIDARPSRGRLGNRRGEDIALYFHVCKLQEGPDGYEAALQRTKEAWSIERQTVEEHYRDHGELAKERLQDVRDSGVVTRKMSDARLYSALLLDIVDDHESDRSAPWRIAFLREKDHDLESEALMSPSQKIEMNRRAIAKELQRIDKLAD